MRLSDIVTEAWRNVRSGAARPLVTIGLSTCVALALALLDMSQVGDIVRQAEQYRTAGASTYRVAADGGIDPRRCENLASVSGVESAGALRATDEPFVPVAMPRSPIPVFDATPGLVAQLGASISNGIVLDAQTAQRLSVRAGDAVSGVGAALPISGTYEYPDDGRDQRLAYAIVRVGEPLGRYDECWVRLWPPDFDTAAWLLRSVVVSDADGTQIQVGQLNSRLGQALDARARFDTRTGQFAWLAALVATTLALLAAARSRRLELSYARHLGVRRVELVALLIVEALVAAGVLLVVAGIASVAIAASLGQPVALPFGLRVAAAAALGCPVGGLIAGLMVSERRVQAYFKSR